MAMTSILQTNRYIAHELNIKFHIFKLFKAVVLLNRLIILLYVLAIVISFQGLS